MKKNVRTPIRSMTYNFSEKDVLNCISLDKLRDWWNKVHEDVVSMENKIKQEKKYHNKSQRWKEKITEALRLQKQLLNIIEGKIIEIKTSPPAELDYCYLEIKFVEVAEKKLNKELFEQIKNEALQRILFEP